ncbi:MAG: protein-glutamate O-methyltransferase CheR [Proteobacteria bacterium]|jgi:chemotaxis protein methyltransferase CheR|nr:protein-glutamate O-methyltransferase CheR [Desulfocapsa sp.]MBU3945621.1 protein-glutamate O-methyltransferase CheR [Pseudomonadota bacterium]MCG2745866.1 protein-glutamate O-methyltransferase CheR [Desulfobacteraceae bacterium]MBU4029663.1 protein-glutamate O-methyltransferase CheR [Pseudomonadota bacterium]MBU4043460.1 protein-glutamate O-methyltransferase CheR [Pseudomonadota bacterium]
MLKISPDELKLVAQYIHDISGIYLEQSKSYLFETRLGSIATEHGCNTYKELYQKAKTEPSKIIERKIIDAISTNETLFFRDKGPFELLQHKLLPELIDARTPGSPALKTNLKIWSAASSTGQELYSIAIIINELIPNISKYTIKLLGTDISDGAVAQASRGKYNKFEMERGLPGDKLQRYFTMFGDSWTIKDEIRAMVQFRKLNLMLPFSGLGKFDIIFCRNVAIYFTLPDRQKLFNKIADSLADDGYLIIGSTESLTGICPRFIPKRHLRSIFYQKK